MKRIRVWLPVLAWAAAIFILSSMPDHVFGPLGHKVTRKIGHVVEYFLLAFLIHSACVRTFTRGRALTTMVTGLLPLVYALSDEFHQGFVPSRICDIRDVAVDMSGVIIFFIILDHLYPVKKRPVFD